MAPTTMLMALSTKASGRKTSNMAKASPCSRLGCLPDSVSTLLYCSLV